MNKQELAVLEAAVSRAYDTFQGASYDDRVSMAQEIVDLVRVEFPLLRHRAQMEAAA